MNYLISVWGDRIRVEEVYCALEASGIPTSALTILGKGYKTADEFGMDNPMTQAKKQAFLMATWLVPFGFLSGAGFSLVTDLHTFAWAGPIGNHLVGGLLGAIAGAMGSTFVGGGVGLSNAKEDALPYRNRLDEGKYLLVVKGSDSVLEKANQTVRRFYPEQVKGYAGS